MRENRPESPQELIALIEQTRATKGDGGCSAEVIAMAMQRANLLPIIQRGVSGDVYQRAFDTLVGVVLAIPVHHDDAYVLEAGRQINANEVWGQWFPVSLPLVEAAATAGLVDA